MAPSGAASPTGTPGKWGVWLAPAVLAAGVAAAYANALLGSFQFDDFNVIVLNPAVHSWAAWARDMPGLRPLLKATYTLNWTLGPGALGFHAGNLLVHAVNALLAYGVLAAFSRRAGGDSHRAGLSAAFFAALLFALHPVQTEAVTYVCGRSGSLMASFYLGSLLAYARGRETGSGLWCHGLSGGLFVLALLVKETAVTLPLALALWEASGPRARRWAWLRGPWLHWLLLLLGAPALLGALGHGWLLRYGLEVRSLGDNLLSQVHGVSHLLAQWLWPGTLNLDPWLPALSHWTPVLAGQAVLLAGLLALGLWNLRRRPWLGFGVLWFFVHLIATNSLVPRLDVANERQLYLPSLGLCWVLATGFRLGVARLGLNPRWGPAGLGVLAALLTLRTGVRNRDYRTEVTLWASSVQAEPRNPRAHNNLGYALELAGEPEPARRAYEAALALDPGYWRARSNLEALKSK